jgi:hypothetical protein
VTPIAPRVSALVSIALVALMSRPSQLTASSSSVSGNAPGQAQMPVPFVGCKSDGQTGPLDAPSPTSDVRLDPAIAARLAVYMPENGPAVLGPRGWSCFGRYGSSGANVIVAPALGDATQSGAQGIAGPGIQASVSIGDTSGRFAVAEFVARLFPTARSFIEKNAADGLLTPGDLPMGPYPADRLTRHSDRIVEYETPPRSRGLGTSSQLLPSGDPIRGVVVLTPDFDVRHLALRLPPEMNDLSAAIIRHFTAGE